MTSLKIQAPVMLRAHTASSICAGVCMINIVKVASSTILYQVLCRRLTAVFDTTGEAVWTVPCSHHQQHREEQRQHAEAVLCSLETGLQVLPSP